MWIIYWYFTDKIVLGTLKLDMKHFVRLCRHFFSEILNENEMKSFRDYSL